MQCGSGDSPSKVPENMVLAKPRGSESNAVVQPGTPTFGVRIFDRPGPELAALWDDCLDTTADRSRFFTHGWYQAWLTTYGTRPPWTGVGHVIALMDDAGRTAGIVPLVIGRKYGLRILSLAGYFQPIRTLVADQSIADQVGVAMAEAILGAPFGWEVLRLGPFELAAPGHRAFLEALRAVSPLTEVNALPRTIVCHDLPASFDDYKTKVLSAKLVKDVLYYERKAKREGNMVIRHETNPAGDRLVSLLSDCGRIEAGSWLAENDRAKPRFRTDQDLHFWEGVARDYLNRGSRLDVWVMDFADRPISFCVALTAGGVRYMIANQYDQEYSKYRTGSILYYYVLEDACRSGVTTVDFGDGDLHYKERWGGVEEGERVDLVSFPPGLKGRSLAAGYRLAKRLKRGGQRRTAEPDPAEKHALSPETVEQVNG